MGQLRRHNSRTVGLQQRGLTLVEGLLTLALIGLVIVLSAGLFSSMAKMGNRASRGEQAVNGLLALERVRSELLEAVLIESPDSSTYADALTFKKIDPSAPNRLVNSPYWGWEPASNQHLFRVTYSLVGEELIRVIEDRAGETHRSCLARKVDGFATSLIESQVVELKIAFSKGDRLDSYTTRVRRFLP